MVRYSTVSLAFYFLINLVFAQANAAPSTDLKGGAMLEYPRGRFQENAAPDFFKWTTFKKVKTWTLKIYRSNPAGQYDPERDLISRFDFLSQIDSLSWTQEVFTRGHYTWILEGYDDKSAKPISIDVAHFEVEPLKNFDMQTFRMGVLAGFSRGTYTSTDPTFVLKYNTTPTLYGLVLKGGEDTKNWELNGFASDFILRGKVRRTITGQGGYYFLASDKNPYGYEFYAGPTFRVFQFPRARSNDDGDDISTKMVSVGNFGLNFTLQRQYDMRVSLYTQAGFDLPVVGDDSPSSEFDQINYNARFGLLYGLFWPIGFSGEIVYQHDAIETKDRGESVSIEQDQWSVIGNLLYAF